MELAWNCSVSRSISRSKSQDATERFRATLPSSSCKSDFMGGNSQLWTEEDHLNQGLSKRKGDMQGAMVGGKDAGSEGP